MDSNFGKCQLLKRLPESAVGVGEFTCAFCQMPVVAETFTQGKVGLYWEKAAALSADALTV